MAGEINSTSAAKRRVLHVQHRPARVLGRGDKFGLCGMMQGPKATSATTTATAQKQQQQQLHGNGNNSRTIHNSLSNTIGSKRQ